MNTATGMDAWRPHDTLPNRLRLVRAEVGISQREGAIRIGITPRIWQNMEDGRAVRDLHKHIAAIATAYGVDREWLMWGGELDKEEPSDPNGPDGSPVVPPVGLEPTTCGLKDPKLRVIRSHDDYSDLAVVA